MKIIYTKKGEEIFVDDEDYLELSKVKWHIRRDGYVVHTIMYKNEFGKWTVKHIFMHRFIMGVVDAGRDIKIDHIDHNTSNNQRSNLRICTNQQNQFNRGKKQNNTSGYKGVYWNKKVNKWCANARLNGKYIHLGLFNTAEAASEVYQEFCEKTHGEFLYKLS